MPEGDSNLALVHYQAGFKPLLYGIIVALILTFFLKRDRTGEEEDMNLIFPLRAGGALS
jgi:hypothetical protein